MKFSDILHRICKGFIRHKSRTALTVLGVVVGCCSVVLMLSIGIGMKASSDATLAQMGDLTKITVVSQDVKEKPLNDQMVASISHIAHTKAVIPKLRYEGEVTLYAGKDKRYHTNYTSLLGEDLKLASEEGYQLLSGEWSDKMTALAGAYLEYSFQDSKRPDGHNTIDRYQYYDWETDSYNELPDGYVDILNEPITVVFGSITDETQENSVQISKELHVDGKLQEDWNKGMETSDGLIMDINLMKDLINEYNKKQGNKTTDISYSEIVVIVDEVSNVETVEKEIRKMGFQTTSMDSIRKPMEKDIQQKQLLLGCVGIISLFVASLGIANTMMMTITERTKEIGIMKSLGCFLGDIRKMVLFEAACIGLLGGSVGVWLSYLFSFFMNRIGMESMFSGDYSYLLEGSQQAASIIPWWLAVFAVLFSVFVGTVSGIYPSEKAVRISALEAIRHD